MPYELARVTTIALAVYAGIGLLAAIPFALFWAGRLDENALHATWGFRLVVIPGAVALWPILAWRLLRGDRRPPLEANAHDRAAARERA